MKSTESLTETFDHPIAINIFALTQSLELYATYRTMMAEYGARWEAAIAALTIKASGAIAPLPKSKMKAMQIIAPSFDVRGSLHGVIGLDLTQINGLGPSLGLCCTNRLIAGRPLSPDRLIP